MFGASAPTATIQTDALRCPRKLASTLGLVFHQAVKKLLNLLTSRFTAPRLTGTRMLLALAIAAIADFLQFVLVPLEWVLIQQIVDVFAMGLIILVIGFHPLLLPTFVVEFIPVVDMLPTWTGCVIAVIALRKREQRAGPETGAPFVVSAPPPEKPPAQIGGGSSDQGTLPR